MSDEQKIDWMETAEMLLKQQLRKLARPLRPCFVMDVDRTLVGIKSRKLQASVRALFRFLCAIGPVHLVTARYKNNKVRELTIRELAQAGITRFASLSLCPGNQRERMEDIAAFKRDCRTRLERQHFRVLMTVGDQWVDHWSEDERRDITTTATKAGVHVVACADANRPYKRVIVKLPGYKESRHNVERGVRRGRR